MQVDLQMLLHLQVGGEKISFPSCAAFLDDMLEDSNKSLSLGGIRLI